jgi:predicted O-methyltransferase YrrM
VNFETVASAVDGIPFMDRDAGRAVYDHLVRTGARDVLELGTAHGVSAAYMAAAVHANGGGRVTTVDRTESDPPAREVLAAAGVADLVDVVIVPYSDYTWWLRNRILERTGAHGAVSPAYDFCFLDGAHDWSIDGLAAVLVERLLRPGGWLLMDDLGWTYDEHGAEWAREELSPEERREPHMRSVFDLVVRPRFSEVSDDGWWGWARKPPSRRERIIPLARQAARQVRDSVLPS